MSINDLDLILKKDPIIATWPARSLCDKPQRVEKDYLVHARTHLSLGDTAKYVDTIFKWVSGVNKGTFIGAVLGDYGEGKTSFLVHVWAESCERKVVTVPPFQWKAFEEIVDAVAGWTQYVLQSADPELARRVQRIHESFRQDTTEGLARHTAEETGRDYDDVLEMVRSLVDSGKMQLTEMSPARLLDFVAEATEVVLEAGYSGLLILLDEPEVTAKKLGSDTVQHFIFDLANELHRREGNYGVFLSMPANFYASAQARFSALTARLEVRRCFPRLGDIYGPDFAQVLWNRYIEEFDLGVEGRHLVTPLALEAIGQVGSSEHKDLSYGPRSVVSAFRRMVDRYRETGKPYEPRHFVQDVLDQEVLVKPEYRSRILEVFRSPEVADENREALTLLGAFPSGLRNEVLHEIGVEDVLRPLARPGGLVHRTAFVMRLRALTREGEVGLEADLVRAMIEEIDAEYAPDRRAFQHALAAFARDVVPVIFSERRGQQLVGWQTLDPLSEPGLGVHLGTMMGSFEQTARTFPQRAVMILVSSLDAPLADVGVPKLNLESGPQQYDLLFHFAFRWHADQEKRGETTEITIPSDESKPTLIRLHLDLTEGAVRQEHLAEWVGVDRMTPLWVLNLLQRMSRVELPKEFEAQWSTYRDMLLRQLVVQFLGPELSSSLARTAGALLEQEITGSGLLLLDRITNLLLKHRYPDYATLIRQPHWQRKIDDYVNALTSTEIPLACKRGREPWRAEEDVATRVLRTSRMNLTGGAFDGLESLIEIKSKGRSAPLEITFHIHPLEHGIRDLVTSQPTGPERKFKRMGKECWYMYISDILPTVLHKGYTIEEMHKVAEIGKARGTFDLTEHRGERAIYCMPLDPEELKAQLRTKLSDLEAEIRLYKQLPDYVTRFDPDVMKQATENVADDADYDRLMTRMNKEFEQNHSRLPGYFDRVQEKLQRIRNQVKNVSDQISGSMQVVQLKVPSAKSPWGSTLGRYIVPNLQRSVDDLRKGSKGLLDQADRLTMRSTYSRERTPAENLTLLLESWSEANHAESQTSILCDTARELLQQLTDFDKWRGVLTQSDQLYDRLLDLKKEPAHQAKAEESLSAFDKISQDIVDHIEIKNVSGLPAHPQFLKRFEDLERERQQYLTTLKGSFDKYKDRVNRYLDMMNVGQRVKVVFNPLEIAGCYDQLFSEAADLIGEHALGRALAEIVMQERELTYARDILRVIEADAAGPLLGDLKNWRESIGSLSGEIDAVWIREVMENEDEAEAQRVVQEINSAFDSVRAVRKNVQKITQAPDRISDRRAQEMYDMVPEGRVVDLKDLILQMMSRTKDPAEALDVSLANLVELFRHNLVQINVERRRR